MSSATTPTPNTPEANRAHNRAVLQELIDLGADLARRVHAQAATAPAAADQAPGAAPQAAPEAALPLDQATIAFDRIARTVRRTIALANHLDAQPAGTAQAPAERRAAARTRLIRGVEDAIHRRRTERDTNTDDLYAELAERLDDPALDLDLANRPLDDIIEELCRDLGVAIQGRAYVWRRRTPEDVASLRARAEAPNKPAPRLHLVPHLDAGLKPKHRIKHG